MFGFLSGVLQLRPDRKDDNVVESFWQRLVNAGTAFAVKGNIPEGALEDSSQCRELARQAFPDLTRLHHRGGLKIAICR